MARGSLIRTGIKLSRTCFGGASAASYPGFPVSDVARPSRATWGWPAVVQLAEPMLLGGTERSSATPPLAEPSGLVSPPGDPSVAPATQVRTPAVGSCRLRGTKRSAPRGVWFLPRHFPRRPLHLPDGPQGGLRPHDPHLSILTHRLGN